MIQGLGRRTRRPPPTETHPTRGASADVVPTLFSTADGVAATDLRHRLHKNLSLLLHVNCCKNALPGAFTE